MSVTNEVLENNLGEEEEVPMIEYDGECFKARAGLFTFKVCNRVKKAYAESTVCGCGEEISKHDKSIAEKAKVGEWKSEVDTIKKPAKYEEMFFRLNETVGNRALRCAYLRVSDDTPAELAAGEILGGGGFNISFLGGCGNKFIARHIEDNLKDAMAKGESFARYDFKLSDTDDEGNNHFLDHNHHLFFLVDDGSVKKYGTEVKLRAKLQEHLVVTVGIPSINLLVGGGLSSIKTIYAALFPRSKNPDKTLVIPVVVLKNSGKVADVLSCVLECDQIIESPQYRKYKRYRAINLMLATKCAAIKNLQLDLENVANLRALSLVRECVELRKDKIFICDVEKKNSNLYDVILTAALQGNLPYLPSMVQFKLAMELQDAGFARKIIDKEKNAAVQLLVRSLDSCDVQAIKNLLETIEIDVGDIWKMEMESLKKQYWYCMGEVLKTARQKFKWRLEEELCDKSVRSWATFMNDILQYLTNENLTPDMYLGGISGCYDKQLINATQAVIIHCIMKEYPSLTKLFWKYDKHNLLSNALLAYKLQSGIIGFYKTVVPGELKESIAYFEEKLVQLLTLYSDTKSMASEVLSRKIPMWRNQTLIDVAGDLEMKFFIEQPACQIVLSQAWSGKDREREKYLNDLKEKGERANLVGIAFVFCHIVSKYLGKPTTKIVLHFLMYLLSVGIFAFYLLIENSSSHETIKWIMFSMVSAVAVDEFRQVIEPRKSVRLNIKRWAASPWNRLDLACILLFYTGFTTKFFHQQMSLSVFTIFFFLWCTKLTQFFRISSSLGPYMVMIFEMLENAKAFFVVLLVAIIGYGVFMTALLFPNSKASWDTLFKVFFRPYLLLFGEMGIESHELGSSKTVFGTPKVSRHAEILVILGMALFLMLANVVLLNLLIAVFSNIYEEVKARSYQIWRFEQYELLQEFKKKPILPFPLSVFENVYLLFRRLCNQQPSEHIDPLEERISTDLLTNFERSCMMKLWPDWSTENVTQQKEENVLAELEKSNLDTIERMKNIARDAKNQKEQLRKWIDASTEKILKRNEETSDNSIKHLSQQFEEMNQRMARLEEMILNLHSGRDYHIQG